MINKLILLATACLPALQAQSWEIDSNHSSAQFSVRHIMISNVKGEFTKVSGKAIYDPKNLAGASLEATIDASSITTREPRRDNHLRSAEFLDVAKFPVITFKSSKFVKTAAGLSILGDLTIRGVTKPVTLTVDGPSGEVNDPKSGPKIGASATTKINRKEFGMLYNAVVEAGSFVVGDDVTITLDVELLKRK